MFPLIETAVAFAVVMLAASLLVSALVQILVKAGRLRGRTVVGMLRSLIHGFRVFHNDPDVMDAQGRSKRDDGPETNFVYYVLRDPVLHTRAEKISFQDDDQRLSELIEYINADDLVALAYNAAKTPGMMSAAENKAGEGAGEGEGGVAAAKDPTRTLTVEQEKGLPLPDSWVGRNGPTDSRKDYATTKNFAAYVGRWFNTIEGTATQDFKKRVRQLTLMTSMLMVVVLNMDGIQILRTLYADGGARAAVAAQATEVQTVATRLGTTSAPAATGAPVDRASETYGDLARELQKTATVVDEANLGVGWQSSWITRRYCAYKGRCGLDDAPPTIGQLMRDTAVWFAGLFFTCVMLSLGAPFWVSTLARLINMKNEVQARKEKEATPPDLEIHSDEELAVRVEKPRQAAEPAPLRPPTHTTPEVR